MSGNITLTEELYENAAEIRKTEKKDWEIRQDKRDERERVMEERQDIDWQQIQEARERERVSSEKYNRWLEILEANRLSDKRDYFASSVLNAWHINSPEATNDAAKEFMSRKAYEWADAMMEARKR